MGIETRKPNSARVYNYLLGGKDNYEVDQLVAQRMLDVAPDTGTVARLSRRFLVQAVRIAAEAGIQQFVDLGAGIPVSPNVHEIAQKIDASARVASVDHDPVVYMHSTALLSGVPGVIPMLADIRRTDELIDRLRTEALIDFDRPVAILLVGVLHFVVDKAQPPAIIARLRTELAPGSYLAFTHGSDESDRSFMLQSLSDTAGSTAQSVYRSRDEVRGFFDGFEFLGPGLVPIQEWLDDGPPRTSLVILGGVCRKP
ncbi:SAM-dependent methyltransferase [Nocardia arthritidis]|uniref:SAM-dependent methyltransferase n=1 Tax=Nocardia arthritidis TaxID=228602 RepID=A0A6G9YTR2_9NOCA|nr:SAM-dependent methyltransferase [Nocardia arthritidis]QIS16530.1 SAM-dependent methyltransferase [Nocardia arthritidis]